MFGPYTILPNDNMTDWVRYDDRYDSRDYFAATGRYVDAGAPAETGS